MNDRGFLEMLASAGMLQDGKNAAILETCSFAGERVDTTLLDMRLLPEDALLKKLGEFTKSRTCSAQELQSAGAELAALISPRVALRFGVVPFRREGPKLDVAALDPSDFLIQDELRVLTGCMIRTHAVLEIRLRQALSRFYGVDLPVRQENIIRRLAKAQQRSSRAVAPQISTGAASTKSEISKSAEAPVARVSSGPRAVVPSELEISEEDLMLFPSLMGEEDAAAAEESIPVPPPLPVSGEAPLEHEDDHDLDLEIRLARSAELLQRAEMRDDIGDALFYFCRPFFRRKLLLIIRDKNIVGWRGEGTELEDEAIRAIEIPQGEPSVFVALMQGTPFWLGPLPPMPRNQELIFAMGPPEPMNCMILPIQVRGRVVAFLYGDAAEEKMPAPPIAELKRLMAKTNVAFQVYLLKAKIRTI